MALASLVFSIGILFLTDCRSNMPAKSKQPIVIQGDFFVLCRTHENCKEQAEFKCKRKDYFVVSDKITEDASWNVLFDKPIYLEEMGVKCEMIKS